MALKHIFNRVDCRKSDITHDLQVSVFVIMIFLQKRRTAMKQVRLLLLALNYLKDTVDCTF